MLTQDKVRGMMVGIAVGDALGIPVETWSFEKIREKYPQGIRKYEIPDGHKWYTGQPAGMISDDTQLSLAVMQGLIEAKEFDMDAIADAHVQAFNESDRGWGNTTREAVRRVANGVSWMDSAKSEQPGRGLGNGVPMKIAPLAAYCAAHAAPGGKIGLMNLQAEAVCLSTMTHRTPESVMGSIFHAWMLQLTLTDFQDVPESSDSLEWVIESLLNCGVGDTNRFATQIQKLLPCRAEQWDFSRIREEFGCGDYFVYNSVPFTYAYLDRYDGIELLYQLAAAGGDTDSNASMAGALVGARCGMKPFEDNPHLLEGLQDLDKVLRVTEQFCEVFEIG